MKALSMLQPYAWLFAKGQLKIDDRIWSTRYRGDVAIHASKGFHQAYYDFLCQNTDWELPRPKDFDFGGFVGVAQLKDCIAPDAPLGSRILTLNLLRSHFGAPGHFGLLFSNPRVMDFVPYRGNSGLFDVPESVLTRGRALP